MRGRVFLAFLLMLLLMAAAFGIGAYRAHFDEKVKIDQTLGSLNEVLTARIEMGNNLLTVAGRHLDAEEPLIISIRTQLANLSGQVSLSEKAAANRQLTIDSKALLDVLEHTASVIQDGRDLNYVTGLLPRGFEQSAQWADASVYNTAAKAFNDRLSGSLSGRIAQFCGIEKAEFFSVGEEGL
jgi:hypothetical protein